MLNMSTVAGVMMIGTLTLGCGAGAPTKRTAADGNATAAARTPVALSGCLQVGGVGPAGYVLRNVRIEDGSGTDPQRQATTPAPQGITEGSWVRLVGGEELRAHAGRRVAITGMVTNTGESTIGTAGSSGNPTPGGRSQAASDEHYSSKVKKEVGPIGSESLANGTAPELKVAGIKDLGEECRDQSIRR